jgi:tetratricopeptide (TPR) repeat protein
VDEKTKSILLKCARVYISTKNWPKAVAEYEPIYSDFPDDPYVAEPLAKAYYETGNRVKAKELYEKALVLQIAKGDAAKAERIKADIERMFGPAQVTGPEKANI